MTDYVAPNGAKTDPKKPVTSEWAKAADERPLAIAEGAPNAPYMQSVWHPYDGYARGDGADGVLWDFDTDGPIAVLETPTFADGFEYKFVFWNFQLASTGALSCEFYGQTTAAYDGMAGGLLPTITVSQYAFAYFELYAPMVVSRNHLIDGSYSIAQAIDAGTSRVASHIGRSHATPQRVSKVKFFSPADFTGAGAKIIMEKRLVNGVA